MALFPEVSKNSANAKVTIILTSAGVLTGIFIGMKMKKGFWPTAGFAFMFGIAGAIAGKVYSNITTL